LMDKLINTINCRTVLLEHASTSQHIQKKDLMTYLHSTSKGVSAASSFSVEDRLFNTTKQD